MTSQNQNSDQIKNGTYIGEKKELSFLVVYKECSFFRPFSDTTSAYICKK
jgi:hypothetical protein